MSSPRIVFRYPFGKRDVTICHFVRPPITEKVNGFRRVVGHGDWIVMNRVVRVRTVEPEAPEMREHFKFALDAARAKRSPMAVVRTETHFQFWDMATERIAFTLTHAKLAAVLDLFVAANVNSIDLATLRAALGRLGS